MSIVFNTSGTVSTTTGSPATQSITATTGSNAALVVAVRANSTTRVPTSATYGGISGTILSSDNNGTIQAAVILFLNPPTGTQTLSIGSGGTEQYVGSYAFWTGVAQSGQPQATTSYTTNNTSQPNTPSLTPNSLGTVITATASADASSVNSGTTLRQSGTTNGSLIADSNGDTTSTQNISVSCGTRAHSVWVFTLSPFAAPVNSGFFMAAAR